MDPRGFVWYLTAVLLVALLWDTHCVSARGGRGRGSGAKQGKLLKCNMRLDYWDEEEPPLIQAVARVRDSTLRGWVLFEQQYHGGPTRMRGELYFMTPGTSYAMYIAERGRHRCNLEKGTDGKGQGVDGSYWAGRHYDPFDECHGESKSCRRHVGDLDPIEADEVKDAVTNFTQWDVRVQLQGPTSVIGRSIIFLSRTSDNDEMTYERIGCAVIGYKTGTNFSVSDYKQRTVEDEPLPVILYVVLALITVVGYGSAIYANCYQREMQRYRIADAAVADAHRRRLDKRRRNNTTSFRRWL